MSRDVVVIGGGVNGLAAAAYLARAGLDVVLCEALNKTGGTLETIRLNEHFSAPLMSTLYALDPRVVKDLKLSRRGLKFAARDMPLVGLRADGKHLVLGRDVSAAARNIAAHSADDAKAWKPFRRELFSLAREMRSLWWGEKGATDPGKLAPFRRLSAAAWLDQYFESDALKATLAFDATAGGLSPFEPGSALVLLWRAAQEMCGLQGAVASLAGATLASSLAEAAQAAGAEIRTGARVAKILAKSGAVSGVELVSGEIIAARLVISTLCRKETLSALTCTGFAENAALARNTMKIGSTLLALALDAFPELNGVPKNARFVIAEKLESFAAAHSASVAGRMPDEPVMEMTIPSASDSGLAPMGQHVACVLVRPAPISANITDKAISTLNRYVPGIAKHIVAKERRNAADMLSQFGIEEEHNSVAHLLASWDERLRTRIPGLLLSDDPVKAISGRAGRLAAGLAVKELKG